MLKKVLPYPALLACAAIGLFVLQLHIGINATPYFYEMKTGLQVNAFTLSLAFISLGLIAIRLSGHILWPLPAFYLFLSLTATFFQISSVSLRLLEWGILALLLQIAELLSMEGNLSFFLALMIIPGIAEWHAHLISDHAPRHAEIFIRSVSWAFLGAGLQVFNAGGKLILKRWWIANLLRITSAAMLVFSILNYFFNDMMRFIHYLVKS